MSLKWVHRRDFLRVGSAAAAGIAATTISAKTLDTITRIEGADPILSVGFAGVTDSGTATVVPVNSLSSGDARFASSAARVTVHGLWEADVQETSPTAVHLSVFFGDVPFMAWSSARSLAPRLSFNIDVTGRDRLLLGIERERASGARSARGRIASWFGFRRDGAEDLPKPAVLEQNGGLCALKLREGTYFVALRRTPWDRTPDWRSLTVDAEELRASAASVLRSGNAPVAFDYLALSVRHV